MTFRLQPLALLACLAVSGAACAADPQVAASPNAADVARDLVPATKPVLPTLTDAPQAAGVAAPQVEVFKPFTFNRLQLSGVTGLAPYQLQLVADPFVNRPMGEPELSALLAALRKRLDQAGLSLALIGQPRIDSASGVVNLNVLEPRLARLSLPVSADTPVSEARVRGLMDWFNLGEGRVLNLEALERVLFALNDMPGVQAKAKLTPSGDEGVYNLSIQTTPRRAWDANVLLDNGGLASIGRVRAGLSARFNNPMGWGDNIDAQLMGTQNLGAEAARLAYELPVGYTPARLALATSSVRYRLGDTFSTLGAHGTATINEAGVSYPLLRSRSRTLIVRAGFEDKTFRDTIDFDGSETRRRLLTSLLSLSWESRDAFAGGGYWGASLGQRFGRVSWESNLGSAPDTVGRYSKYEFQFSRLQQVAGPVSLFASVSQQLASRNLDGAEKLGLGGARGVRAYASAEAASDDATILNTELRWWLTREWTVFALFDYAHGRLSHDPVTSDPNTVNLRGAGLGVSATIPDWVTLRATLAWRGNRVGTADPGHDKPRLAFQAQHSF